MLGYLEEYAKSGNAVLIATHEKEAIALSNKPIRIADGKIDA